MPAHASFDRTALLAAFDRVAEVALENDDSLEIAVYGGSALMLASNFRYSSEGVDIGELGRPWPDWLHRVVQDLASENGWSPTWLNDAVEFHLSPLASRSTDHHEFGTFPRRSDVVGLVVFVPTAEYMLALKLKSMRINDPGKGQQEIEDITNLLQSAGIESIDEAIHLLGKFFPRSTADADKQRFLLRHFWPSESEDDAPTYPVMYR